MDLLAENLIQDLNSNYDEYTPLVFLNDVKKIEELALQHTDRSYRIGYRSKRNGKTRTLTIPNDGLKLLQGKLYTVWYAVYKNMLNIPRYYHINDVVQGFMVGKSVKDNAVFHIENHAAIAATGNTMTLFKGDIKGFFDNITFQTFESALRASILALRFAPSLPPLLAPSCSFIFDRACARLLALTENICFHAGVLPQGSPTSPVLSNMLMFMFDYGFYKEIRRVFGFKAACTYTRYADDICVSLIDHNKQYKVIHETLQTMVNTYLAPYKLSLNPKKVEVLNNTKRMSITGVMTNKRDKVREFVLDDIKINDTDNKAVLHLYKLPQDITSGYSTNTPMIKRQYLKAKIDKIIKDISINKVGVSNKHYDEVLSYWNYVNNINPINFLKFRNEIARFSVIRAQLTNFQRQLLSSKIIKPYIAYSNTFKHQKFMLMGSKIDIISNIDLIGNSSVNETINKIGTIDKNIIKDTFKDIAYTASL